MVRVVFEHGCRLGRFQYFGQADALFDHFLVRMLSDTEPIGI
jgi:hypothetical protein